MREKLIELLTAIDGVCPNDASCYNCEYDDIENCSVHAKADHLIANGVTVQQWIPVTERLPDTAERVLVCKTWLGRVYKPEYGYYQDYPNSKGCWYVLTEFGYYPQREVTHWMPLPEPPSEERI